MQETSPHHSVMGLLVCVVLMGGCSVTAPPSTGAPLRSPSDEATLVGAVQTIVLDAGHGGHDPGTSHFGLQEKRLALDIARRVRASLQQAGLRVVMTRDADRFIPLSERPAVANRLGADLFVSVHINANRRRSVSGAEVYYPRQSVVASTAQWPPWVRPTEVGVPSTTLRQILWDMVLGRMRSRSSRLASSVCQAMHETLAVECERKAARFVVLREAQMPAVLVEVGYVSNAIEARRLRTVEYRQAAAQAIARGIVRYVRGLGAQHI